MIVVDSNVIGYFWLNAERTAAARRVRRKDADWAAPFLWGSEFRSVLWQHMKVKNLPYGRALWFARKAEDDLRGKEHAVDTADVLKLAERADRSAYDCEYVALAQSLDLKLVTGDRAVARKFPRTAILMEDYVA